MSDYEKKPGSGTVRIELTINKPTEIASVLIGAASPDVGILCHASGDVKPPVNHQFARLYFKVARNGETYDAAAVMNSYEAVLSANDIYGTNPPTGLRNWTLDYNAAGGGGFLQAKCGPSGAEKSNTLYAVQYSERMTMMGPIPANPELKSQVFKGRCCTQCPAIDAETTEVVRAAVDPRVAVASAGVGVAGVAEDVAPVCRRGGWLKYDGLSAGAPYYGFRLMRNGNPLRARTIAVAATDVNWSYAFPGFPRRHVRRPVGDLRWNSLYALAFEFESAPFNALVVSQRTLDSIENVVASQCRECPDAIHLNPDNDVFVQVNKVRSLTTSQVAGTYDLWVKVID